MSAIRMGRSHRILTGVVVAGAVVIAAIGFAGSYAAVRDLALRKGFGWFANVFPIGVDAGIVVLLALDLLLTWIRIPFPLLRQTAWLLTAATIAFNGAAAWPDPLGVGMHAVIPVLFVVSVEAARHAVGRVADITADRHMESVRIARWLLAFPSTFRLWRRMKLWELRSYEEVIRLEQERLVYQARLRARFGRAWRRKAPVESLMPLRLARYGVPLAQTAQLGLEAAGITVPVPQIAAGRNGQSGPDVPAAGAAADRGPEAGPGPGAGPGPEANRGPEADRGLQAAPGTGGGSAEPAAAPAPAARPAAASPGAGHGNPAVAGPSGGPEPGPLADEAFEREFEPEFAETEPEPEPDRPRIPVGPGRERTLAPLRQEPEQALLPDGVPEAEVYVGACRTYVAEQGAFPSGRQFARFLHDKFRITNQDGNPLSEEYLAGHLRDTIIRLREENGL